MYINKNENSNLLLDFAGRPPVLEELCVQCAISTLLVSTLSNVGSQSRPLQIREYSGPHDEHKVAGSSNIQCAIAADTFTMSGDFEN